MQRVGYCENYPLDFCTYCSAPSCAPVAYKQNPFPCFPKNVFQRIQSAVYTGIIVHFYVRTGTPGFVCCSLLCGEAGWNKPRRLWEFPEDWQNITYRTVVQYRRKSK